MIFTMSSMNANNSDNTSRSTVKKIVSVIEKISNNNLSQEELNKAIDKYNVPVRKLAHACEYCIFTVLLIIALKNSGIEGKKVYLIALLICFLYSCSDEFHQTFVQGRSGQFRDCMIDTTGGIFGCFIHKIVNK